MGGDPPPQNWFSPGLKKWVHEGPSKDPAYQQCLMTANKSHCIGLGKAAFLKLRPNERPRKHFAPPPPPHPTYQITHVDAPWGQKNAGSSTWSSLRHRHTGQLHLATHVFKITVKGGGGRERLRDRPCCTYQIFIILSERFSRHSVRKNSPPPVPRPSLLSLVGAVACLRLDASLCLSNVVYCLPSFEHLQCSGLNPPSTIPNDECLTISPTSSILNY